MFQNLFRSKSILAGFAALMAGTTAGVAADIPMPPPPAPPPAPVFRPAIYEWSGLYVGINAGLGFLDTFYVPSSGPDPELAGGGYLIGGLVGYNMQFDNIVLGVEVDASWGRIAVKNTLDNVKFNVPFVSTARLRAGVVLNDKTLIYATGGLAWAEGKMFLPAFGERATEDHFGYVVGGGMEHAAWDAVNVRLEYLYGSFGKKTYNFTAGDVRMGLDNLHMVRAGLIWNFDSDS